MSCQVSKQNYGMIILLFFWAKGEGFVTHGAQATAFFFVEGIANHD